MIQIPLTASFSTEHWKQSTYFMLEKIEGLPHVDKLRIIQLLSPEFNATMKININKKVMRREKT